MDQKLVELLRGINTALTVFLDSMSEEVSDYYDEEEDALKRKYPGINFKPPKAVVAELKKGLEWHAEGHSGDGLVAATVSWARKMANGANISPEKAVKMRAWLARHESDKSGKGFKPGEEGFPSPGRVAWALWGGDPAVGWSNKLVTQMEAADRKKSADSSVQDVESVEEPIRLVPPSTYDSAEDQVEPVETLKTETETENSMADIVEFPLTPQQVMKAKRKDLRELVELFNMPIKGPNGEDVSELMVGPLREAIIGYIRMAELAKETGNPDVFFSEKTGESVVETEFAPEAAPEAEPVDKEELTQISEPEVESEEVEPAKLSPEMAMRVDGFLSWVTSQNSEASKTQKGSELEGFFSENLNHLDEESRKPVDLYFEKLECNHNCSSCPNGKSQPVFCYGIFDEEVSEFSLDDAVNKDQYFKCSPSGD